MKTERIFTSNHTKNRFRIVRGVALGLAPLAGVLVAHAQPDYAPARWTPPACTKMYTSGNGHHFVVIHDMEGYYQSTISYLNRCDTDATGKFNVEASIHYEVNGLSDSGSDFAPGDITQMVRESNYAWHVRCWNTYTFGTEHEGFASNPAWYTKSMYIASSGLQRHLCDAYAIAKDRNHVIGHNEWQTPAWKTWMAANWPAIDTTCNTHTDPGVYWNWGYFMNLIKQTNVTTGRFWDLNGATAGTGSATPSGTWDLTSTNWSSDPNGTVTTGVWAGTDDAVFSAGTDATNNYTVTVSGTQPVFSVRVNNGNVTFNGGKLYFTGIGTYYSNYVAAGHTATFNTPFIGRGAPDKWGPGTAIYNGASTTTNNTTTNFLSQPTYSHDEGTIAVGNNLAFARCRLYLGASGGPSVILKSASATAYTLPCFLIFRSASFTFGSGGDLTFSEDVNCGTGTKTITVSNITTFAAAITNTAAIVKTGPGTLVYTGSLTNHNTYGATTVSAGTLKLNKPPGTNAIPAVGVTVNTGGTLLLAAANQLNTAAPMTLAGGIFNTGGFGNQSGTLKLTAASQFDMGAGASVIKFAASSAVAWTAGTTLTVTNWNGSINGGGSDQLVFGTTSAGLTAAQVNQVKFINPPGFAAGTYSAKILSSGEVVPIAVAPSITIQPQNQMVNAGSNATFTVTAGGTPTLKYQWRFNGTGIGGATTSSYTLNNVQIGNVGNYSVVITNIAGSVTSDDAALGLNTPPAIAAQPQSQTSFVGSNVIFSVTATGTAPLSYQWQFGGTNVATGTDSSLVLSGITFEQAGTYSVVVSNVAGITTSSNAVLAVYLTPASTLGAGGFANGQFQFEVNGVTGYNYVVEVSTNLVDWTPVWTNTAPFTFTDGNTTNFPSQYYRAVYVP
ncbi:MAG: hypothetical protein JWQ71_741 [Pedosphaera sp.]|nr:hypothetical protein [Pedosphaera sp.]